MTQRGDTTVGDAEVGEPTMIVHTAGPGLRVPQQALRCLDHDKRWLTAVWTPMALIISLRGLFLPSQRGKCNASSLHGERGEDAWAARENRHRRRMTMAATKSLCRKFCI